ncbi:hypothetical protein C0993_008347, partial [Termitomyces sp. T159_Od127]
MSLGDSENGDTVKYDFTIDVVDIFTLDTCVMICQATTSKSPAESLVSQGYLGATLEQLTIALSLRKPSFSVDAFAEVLCDLYSIPFHRQYGNALSNAFDAYLGILRVIEKCVAKELGRNGKNWHVLNACPPCTYELENEPPLTFSRMFVVDGNNSLKRVQLTGERNTDGAPTVPNGPPCADNWKAAAADTKKKMWAIFKEAGIFASCCRHGLILWIVDMMRSGEL